MTASPCPATATPTGIPAVVDEATVENARRLDSETPIPQRVRVVGTLDMIRMSSQGFELVLDDGTPARGVLIEGDMAALKSLAVTGPRPGPAIYRLPAASSASTPAAWSLARTTRASGR